MIAPNFHEILAFILLNIVYDFFLSFVGVKPQLKGQMFSYRVYKAVIMIYIWY